MMTLIKKDGEWHRVETYYRATGDEVRKMTWLDGQRMCDVCGERPAAIEDRQKLMVCRPCAVAVSEDA